MTRVAPFAQQELILFHTLNTQARLSNRELQLATGRVAQQYSQASGVTSRLLSVEAERARAKQYMSNIDAFSHRLSLADLSLSAIDDAARTVSGMLAAAINFPDAHAGNLREAAANARNLLRDMLNMQDGDRYLFAGTRSDHRPVDLSNPAYTNVGLIKADGVTVDSSFYQAYYTQTLGNTLPYAQGSFYNQIFFEKNGVAPTAPLPADPNNPTIAEFSAEDPALFQFYVGRMNSAASIAAPKLDYYGGDQGLQTVHADDNLDVTLPVRADDTAFAQILAALDAIANLPDDTPDTDSERAIVAKARDILSNALSVVPGATFKSLAAIRTDIASAQGRLATTRERHANFTAYADGAIGDMENIDQAEVIVRLQSDRTALDASFATIAQLKSLTLLNYL